MLRFACKPDAVFTSLINDALELGMDALKFQELEFDVHWIDNETFILFGSRVDILLKETQKLYEANKHSDLFMPTDYHFRLLDRVLDWYCDIYNDSVNDGTCLLYKGKRPVTHLDINSIRGTFFWDCDYELLSPSQFSMDPEQISAVLNIVAMTQSGKNIQKGNQADLQDLTLQKHTYDEDWDTVPRNFWFS